MSENGIVLVCVTAQQSSRRLIECGKRLSAAQNTELRICSVLPQRQCFSPDLDTLIRLQEYADEANAQMKVCFSDTPVECVCEILHRDPFRALVTGFPGKNSTKFITEIHTRFPQIPIYMVDDDGTAYSIEQVRRSDANDHTAKPSRTYIQEN